MSSKVASAVKWSAITEVMAKLVAPVSSMVLARLLTPEAFGVVATLTMLITFAELFTDAGFQRYIIHYEFESEEDKYKTVNVAFISNLVMSLLIWCGIIFFREDIARLVGNPGKGNVLAVACVAIPLAAFSSIQQALFKRHFDFKALFYVRVVGVIVPLAVTIPAAIFYRNYWALVIGTITNNVATAVILTIKSPYKPNLYYSWLRLRRMLSYCSWSLVDSVLVWMTGYVDIFLIGIALNEYYLGLYKTSMVTVGQITGLAAGAIFPVLMPAIARVQNDVGMLRKTLLVFQKYTAVFLLPLGVGIYVFRNLITSVLLGQQWMEAASFIGVWGLADVIVVVFARYCSVVFPAIGKPKISVVVQILHLAVLLPVVYVCANYSFEALFWGRTLVRFQGVLVNLIFVYILIRLSVWTMLNNIVHEIVACLVVGLLAHCAVEVFCNSWAVVFVAFVSVISYMGLLMLFGDERKMFKHILSMRK